MPSMWITEIYITGSWTNTQYVGSAPDITGLNVYAEDARSGSAVPLSSDKFSVSPSVWAASGQQTATFTYLGSDYITSEPPTTTSTVNVINSGPTRYRVIDEATLSSVSTGTLNVTKSVTGAKIALSFVLPRGSVGSVGSSGISGFSGFPGISGSSSSSSPPTFSGFSGFSASSGFSFFLRFR